MRLRRVPELGDERVPLECLLDDAALNAAAAPVNEADLAKPAIPGGVDVLLDDRFDVARLERVEVEGVFYWNAHVNSQPPTSNSQGAWYVRPSWELGIGSWAFRVSCRTP